MKILIFFPNSTWTSGRNKLREYILENNEEDYDYFIFLDEDIEFINMDNNTGFQKFEEYLNLYRPEIGCPRLIPYIHYEYLKSKITNSLYYDGICNAMSIIDSKVIFPWHETFDAKNWWMSQNIVDATTFNVLKLQFSRPWKFNNIQHSDYVKRKMLEESLNYCFEKCLEINDNCDIELFKYIKHICYFHNPIKDYEKFYEKFRGYEISHQYYYDYLKNIYEKLAEKNIVKSSELNIVNDGYFY